MRTALYARVSTRDKGQNPDNQLQALREYAAGRGFTVVTEYVDHDSGAKEHRPALTSLLRDAARGRFDFLLFWSLDRITRRGVWTAIDFLHQLDTHNIKFRSLQQPEIDTSTTWGPVIVAVFAALAQLEREMLRERTKAGLRRAQAQGKQLGRPRRIVDVRQVEELRQAGNSFAAIAKTLGTSAATIARRIDQKH